MPFDRTRLLTQQSFCHAFGIRQQIDVTLQIRDLQHRYTALAHTKKLAGATQMQIGLRNLETIGRFINHLEPRTRQRLQRLLIEQDATALFRAASDPPAQLMQLRKPHALSMLDYHQTGIRHIDANLDHRGRHQQL